ncbi:nicotinate-nucleotide diphosphorylase (carboxylating) [Methylovirgula ligni]|uniref:Probable nicotinate-nucleotide pyrophosphorylase [carboxylating] n=1 Tax=Methylovirgula ligni TaxID=569860 RepID=A0A3D9YXK1_9HYPH|nr:carboxylating nicotinate-nucleotide diphosphorylase [Methylovirgula ligni]QAY94702.1 nicotinate-nucleotide diphosphorylase (carboxylating) [Methylovirgula ligni]REF87412.1 nicotinate-nucleotide pyrophosphorylase [carboxylating] [Methylovirgula ligni]
MTLTPPPRVILEPLVRTALIEDLGLAGDLTTNAIVPADAETTARFVTRKAGIVAGLDLAALTFQLVDPALAFSVAVPDGARVAAGETIATVSGRAASILVAERVALNFLGHLSGIATATAHFVAAVEGHKAQIVCTRKTTPGLRAVEKYAVRAGGGHNHRFGLDDAVLIKDNHIAIAGGVGEALRRAKQNVGHLVKIEIEVDSLAQLRAALAEKPDAVLLDNMSPAQLAEAVEIVGGRALTEASGGVSLDNVARIAASGVDLISIGWLTHSAPVLDIGLDFPA